MPNNPFEPMIKNIGDYVSRTLYAQGVIPPIGIGNYEGLALSSPADTHLLAAKDPVIDEIAVGMTGNEINADFVTGTPPLTLSDSEGYPLQWWQVNLSPYQEGTGDPAPDNVRPIHGTDKINIVMAGKNLFPMNISFSGTGYANRWLIGQHQELIPFLKALNDLRGKKVAYSVYTEGTTTGVPIGNIRLYQGATQIFSCYPNSYTTVNTAYDYTLADTLTIYGSNTGESVFKDLMICIGDTPQPYEPYKPITTTSITLPETIYNGEVFAGGAVSRWGEVDLGTLTWAYSSVVDAFVSNGVSDIIKSRNSLCEIYSINYTSSTVSTITDAQSGTLLINKGAGTTGNFRTGALIIKDTRFTDAEQLTTAISGYKFIFELNTPTIHTLSTPSIPTPTGNATTWATAEDGVVDSMEVTYVGKA